MSFAVEDINNNLEERGIDSANSSSDDKNNNSSNRLDVSMAASSFNFQFQHRVSGIGLTKKTGEKSVSPVNTAPVPFNCLSWRLHVYPAGINDLAKGYVSVQLEVKKNCKLPSDALRQMTFKIGILNHANRLITSKVSTANFAQNDFSCPLNFAKLHLFSTLKNECAAPLTNDTLILRCKVKYDECLLMRTVPSLDLNDIERLYYHQLFTDVVLRVYEDDQVKDDYLNNNSSSNLDNNSNGVTGDGDGGGGSGKFYVNMTRKEEKSGSFREIRAHKVILAARSSVFATMFSQSNYKEASSSVVTITDLSYDVVKELLIFMYTGHVGNLNEETAFALLYASEKYNIENLTKLCVRFFASRLTPESAGCVLQIAECFNLHHLKQLASAKLGESES